MAAKRKRLTREEEWGRTWWVFVPLLTVGMLSWAVFLYAGIRTRRRLWLLFAGVYLAALLIAFAVGNGHNDDAQANIEGAMLICLAGAGSAHALGIRREFLAATGELDDRGLETAEHRLAVQDRGRRLVAEDPIRARRLGVGRPDVPKSFDAGLIDVNSAPAEVLGRLPGIDEALARRIAAARDELGQFSSLDDLDLVLDLPEATLEKLRDVAVFVPA